MNEPRDHLESLSGRVERIIAEREVARAECAALRAGADDLLRDHERDLEALHVTREQLSMAVALLQERTRENDDECAKFLATFENNKQETK